MLNILLVIHLVNSRTFEHSQSIMTKVSFCYSIAISFSICGAFGHEMSG